MAVDWEQRIDFDRLRRERLARAKDLLRQSELGALLVFDMNNVRYLTATHIGTWAQDKISRFALLPQNNEPLIWDFGSAARHHQIYAPWLGERSRAGGIEVRHVNDTAATSAAGETPVTFGAREGNDRCGASRQWRGRRHDREQQKQEPPAHRFQGTREAR